ncbi:hypothetical protein BO70DRAFT_285797, partial [Aspergillus heteromorphus CBS 117.55]
AILDSFDVAGPEDRHRCLVHPPLWESVLTFLHRNPIRRLPVPVLAFVLKRLFLALDYLHSECQIIHAGMWGVCNCLSSCLYPWDQIDHLHRLDLGYLRRNQPLFTGYDPEHQTYRSRAHLAEMIGLLGPPPLSVLAQGELSHKFRVSSAFLFLLFFFFFFFSDILADFRAGIPLPGRIPLEDRETTLEGQDKVEFLNLIRKMLQWESDKRSSAKELAEDEWIRKHTT